MSYRISQHPIVNVKEIEYIKFFFNNKELLAREGEVISSALFANGIKTFGYHHKDNSPQGIFCANGQCSQCLVIADGLPVKACITQVKEGMKVFQCEGLPEVLNSNTSNNFDTGIKSLEVDVLIIGGGPAGLGAAIELGTVGIDVLLIDDKHKLGGKLILQTHKFFGSVNDCYAGTRGIDIANILEEEINKLNSVKVWLNSVAIGVFSDKAVGIIKDNKYYIVKPKKLLIATGAREKGLLFNGWDKVGVYGAGAFQTLLNRDLVKPSSRIFVIGAGNVGLIAAYHALQAGIKVVGVAEILPQVTGYKVHADKIKVLGVPIYTSHKVLEVFGKDCVEAITIAEVNSKFEVISGTEKTFNVDTVLISVGLSPVDEFYKQAKEFNMDVFCAGDAYEIAEASSAIFNGKIVARQIANSLGLNLPILDEWFQKQELLKSKPKLSVEVITNSNLNDLVYPVIRCYEEIPCDPCAYVCPSKSIEISPQITNVPKYLGGCNGCTKCVAICPALAIVLIDFRKDPNLPIVTLPYEIIPDFKVGDYILCADINGKDIDKFEVVNIRLGKWQDNRYLISLKVPREYALNIAGIKIQSYEDIKPVQTMLPNEYNPIVCRCERVKYREIINELTEEPLDLNQVKGVTRVTMGACGGKTCSNLIKQFIKKDKPYTDFTIRPLFVEVPFNTFLNR